MTIAQLEYIVALDNFRHFVTAAESCNVSQPNLTTQVKKLEEEIGVKIFDRDTKPLQPTTAGNLILLKARKILKEISELREFVLTEKESLQGEFTLGVIPTISPYLLPLFLPEFVKSNPQTKLIIREMQTAEIILELQRGTLDVGLLATPLEEKTIREMPLFYEPFLLYLPQEHPFLKRNHIIPAMLDPNQILVLDEGHCFRDQILSICNSKASKNNFGFEFQSGSIESLMRLVDKGVGYTLVPEMAVLDKKESGLIRRFDAPEPVREISLVVAKNFTKNVLVHAFRKSILLSIPERFQKEDQYKLITWK
ncbi:hydrogen peroxide-inducible genes activator [Algoriphagus aquimarinus]|uniref:hydrogen peroxide-inducible genes activator n=1 Tax=Algoriphagus aquimarinus TaxID=237018 RepID=UPI0030D9E505|tara:strand:+ start:1159 stop:2088 length:930 start_codon:yes stop_codon:yes gene_type:complete